MLNINEQIHELRLQAQSTPIEIPEERAYLLCLADDLEWQRDQYADIVRRVRAVADVRFEAREARQSELRRLLARDEITRAGKRELEQIEQRQVNAPQVMLEMSRHVEAQQRLTHWCAELKLAGLLMPAEERAIGIVIPPSPGQLARRKQEQADHDRLIKIRDGILATIPAGWARREALTLWNSIGGFVDQGKINQWVEQSRAAPTGCAAR